MRRRSHRCRVRCRAFAGSDGNEDNARWLSLTCRMAVDLWDDELWYVLATLAEGVAHDTGALGQLANALNHLAAFSVHSGAFATAAVLIDEIDVITQATGLPPVKYAACKLAASRGDQVQMQAYPDHLLENAVTPGEGFAVGLYWGLAALLHNGYGQYGKALAATRQACEHEDVMVYGWALARAGRGRRPRRTAGRGRRCARTIERTYAGERHRMGARGRGARSCAVDRRRGLLCPVDRAACADAAPRSISPRSRLVYGEWLRRQSRRTDAHEHLRSAHESFSHMGAEAFAERARRELLATGETARRRTADTRDSLTPQELQVGTLARDGYTNPEIAAQLFISPRTVEYHLGKVFVKLGVKNRRGLRDALAGASH